MTTREVVFLIIAGLILVGIPVTALVLGFADLLRSGPPGPETWRDPPA